MKVKCPICNNQFHVSHKPWKSITKQAHCFKCGNRFIPYVNQDDGFSLLPSNQSHESPEDYRERQERNLEKNLSVGLSWLYRNCTTYSTANPFLHRNTDSIQDSSKRNKLKESKVQKQSKNQSQKQQRTQSQSKRSQGQSRNRSQGQSRNHSQGQSKRSQGQSRNHSQRQAKKRAEGQIQRSKGQSRKYARRQLGVGSTHYLYCISCSCKTEFVRRKIICRDLCEHIHFNDGTSLLLRDGRSYLGDECLNCSQFIVR